MNKLILRLLHNFQTLTGLLLMTTAISAYAHRGPADEIDTCRIRVGSEKIHFTAYTPTFTQGTGYCQAIPNIGPTNLVFDYEGHKLRNDTVEFEITKEPEGTRIFHQEPKKLNPAPSMPRSISANMAPAII
nr:hypothetical protein [Methylomarinum sp. Ch1-1]MDP4519732.1 hypothetical protein [Methylomarinum sp. Ch1-1]